MKPFPDLLFRLIFFQKIFDAYRVYYKYEKAKMSGAIPLAFSLGIPLIISKQTNEYYKFKNVIEFDKTTDDDIILTDISPELIENERNELMSKFNNFILLLIKYYK